MWPFRQDSAPALPPASDERFDAAVEKAVAARMDVFSNVITGLGLQNSKTACNRWQPGIAHDEQTLENIYAFDPVAARIIDKESQDALQKGFGVDPLDEEQQLELDDFNERRQFLTKFDQARKWERLFGGALIFMQIEDGQKTPGGEQDTAAPVNFESIARLGQLTVLSRYDVHVESFVNDPRTGELSSPAFYRINDTNQVIHPTRAIVFPGFRLTRDLMVANGGWGGSVMDRVFKAVERYDTTHQYMAEGITRITQGVFQSPEFSRAGKSGIKEKLEARMKALGQWMGILGDIAIGPEEKYEVIKRGLEGFKDGAEVFVSALVAATDMPRSILLGETPGGLNSGENAGDWQAWTSHLSGIQTTVYDPRVKQYLNVVFRAANSPVIDVPERWSIDWPQLFQLSEVDESTVLTNVSTAAVALKAQGIITANEARENSVIQTAFPQQLDTTEDQVEGEVEEDPVMAELAIEQGAEGQGVTAAVVGSGADVQKTALNGAQITSLQTLVEQVAQGIIPAESAVGMALFSFPTMTPEEARAIFVPAAEQGPPPKPEQQQDGVGRAIGIHRG